MAERVGLAQLLRGEKLQLSDYLARFLWMLRRAASNYLAQCGSGGSRHYLAQFLWVWRAASNQGERPKPHGCI